MQIKKIYVGMFVLLMVLLCVQAIAAENNEMIPDPVAGTTEGTQPEEIEPEKEQNSTSNEGAINQLEYTYSYNWRHRYRYQIQEGISNETVVIECNLTKKDGKMYCNSYEYQKGLVLEVKSQNQHKLEIKVDAEFKEGKVLVLNIEKNAFQLKNSNQLRVKFDGKEIKERNIEEVMAAEGSEPKYVTSLGEDGGQYIVYVPHFSEHTITLENIATTQAQVNNFIVGAIGAAIVTLLVLILIIVRIRKNKKI